MTNDQFPFAGESFPGMIDPIIARRARPRNFEQRTSRFPWVFANRPLTDRRRIRTSLEKCSRILHEVLRSFERNFLFGTH